MNTVLFNLKGLQVLIALFEIFDYL